MPVAANIASAVDPVCGMFVNKEVSARTHVFENETYYFCSAHCLERFRKDPGSFLSKAGNPTVSAGAEAARTQISHNRIEPSLTAGSSPAGVEYTCPMHPEIRR